MGYVKWIVTALVVVLLGSIMYYTLPRHDVVRIVGVETRLESFGINRFFYASVPSGMADSESRDVRYIETLRPEGGERVFRNEDTGWGWPPYFKMNSADLQTRARDLVSTSDEPRWVRVTYYGVRSNLLSIYPNALRVRLAAGPDDTVFPWTRSIGFVVLTALAVWIWFVVRRFRRQRVDPFLADMAARTKGVRDWLRRTWNRLTGRG